MGLTTVNGLPAHVLLVHAVVVLVPLAALLVVLSAAWPAARRRLGVVSPLVALATLIAVPVTTDAGEWLAHHVERDPLVRAHTRLGDELLPWVIGVFLVALAVWGLHFWLDRRVAPVRHAEARELVPAGGAVAAEAPSEDAATRSAAQAAPVRPRWVGVASAVLVVASLAAGVGATVEVYRIGESGAQAAWHDGFSSAPTTSGTQHDGR